jgi:DnaJ family protein A protein 2
MPSHANPFVKGDLYVVFTVEFPEDGDLKPDQIEVLKKALPGASMAIEYDPDTAEVAHLEFADVKNFGKGGVASHDAAYNSDEEQGGAQPVQCQQS